MCYDFGRGQRGAGDGMAELNLGVLRAAVVALRSRAVMAVVVGTPGRRRTLYFQDGQLTAAGSEFLDDRLGQLLVREGRLDPGLLEPIEQAAKQAKRLFGNQLLADGLLRPDELAAALERQVLVRFEKALTTEGPVATEPRASPQQLTREPIGALVMGVFRAAEMSLVDSIASRIALPTARLAVPADDLTDLRLKPPELRVARLLASGKGAELPAAEPHRSNALRVVAGLGALGLLSLGGR